MDLNNTYSVNIHLTAFQFWMILFSYLIIGSIFLIFKGQYKLEPVIQSKTTSLGAINSLPKNDKSDKAAQGPRSRKTFKQNSRKNGKLHGVKLNDGDSVNKNSKENINDPEAYSTSFVKQGIDSSEQANEQKVINIEKVGSEHKSESK